MLHKAAWQGGSRLRGGRRGGGRAAGAPPRSGWARSHPGGMRARPAGRRRAAATAAIRLARRVPRVRQGGGDGSGGGAAGLGRPAGPPGSWHRRARRPAGSPIPFVPHLHCHQCASGSPPFPAKAWDPSWRTRPLLACRTTAAASGLVPRRMCNNKGARSTHAPRSSAPRSEGCWSALRRGRTAAAWSQVLMRALRRHGLGCRRPRQRRPAAATAAAAKCMRTG
jgi:hypothetical protein